MEGVSGKGRQRCVCVCVCVCMRRVCGVRVHACLCGHVCLTYHNVHATTLPTELEFTEASLCRCTFADSTLCVHLHSMVSTLKCAMTHVIVLFTLTAMFHYNHTADSANAAYDCFHLYC